MRRATKARLNPTVWAAGNRATMIVVRRALILRGKCCGALRPVLSFSPMRRLARHLFALYSAVSLLLCLAVCVRASLPREEADRVGFVQSQNFYLESAFTEHRAFLHLLLGWPRDVHSGFFWSPAGSQLGSPGLFMELGQGTPPDEFETYFLGCRLSRTRVRTYLDSTGSAAWLRQGDPRSYDRSTNPLVSWRVSLPMPLLASLLAVPAAAWVTNRLRARLRSRYRHAGGLCPSCGYDLRASRGRCPECGGEKRGHF